jgi:hypothetical protein
MAANRAARWCAAILVAVCAPLAHANVFDDLVGDDDKDWVEVVPQTPSVPNDADLVPFYVSPATQFRFFVDTHSLSIGTDGVVHYTLIARSPQGAQNASFEGMRCTKRLYKVYAYLGPKGFDERPSPEWTRISEADANRQRASLYKDYFCVSGRPGHVKDLVDALKTKPYDQIGP